MRGVRGRLLARSGGDGLLYVAELHDGAMVVPKTDHLTCFLPGLLALGHLHGINTGEHDRAPVLFTGLKRPDCSRVTDSRTAGEVGDTKVDFDHCLSDRVFMILRPHY